MFIYFASCWGRLLTSHWMEPPAVTSGLEIYMKLKKPHYFLKVAQKKNEHHHQDLLLYFIFQLQILLLTKGQDSNNLEDVEFLNEKFLSV